MNDNGFDEVIIIFKRDVSSSDHIIKAGVMISRNRMFMLT